MALCPWTKSLVIPPALSASEPVLVGMVPAITATAPDKFLFTKMTTTNNRGGESRFVPNFTIRAVIDSQRNTALPLAPLCLVVAANLGRGVPKYPLNSVDGTLYFFVSSAFVNGSDGGNLLKAVADMGIQLANCV
jgi:hypothetical protein